MRHFYGSRRGKFSASMIIVLMGVSGSGKSTVGRLLARRFGWTFYEGDDFHPEENIEKMSRGIALSDEDRLPWLSRLKDELDACSENGSNAVVACSALRSRYRAILAAGASDLRFVYLKGDPALIRERMSVRRDHYMKPYMLDSQLASLEEPDDAIMADIRSSPQDIVLRIVHALRLVTRENFTDA
jgi:gluconokinase